MVDEIYRQADVKLEPKPLTEKREALENVLVPYKLMENREMLLRAGFRYCDVFFKWYNFSGMVAVKS